MARPGGTRISPRDNSVIVQHRGAHKALVNYRPPMLAKVDESTPNPAHGEHFRDTYGRPNACLLAAGAFDVCLQVDLVELVAQPKAAVGRGEEPLLDCEYIASDGN